MNRRTQWVESALCRNTRPLLFDVTDARPRHFGPSLAPLLHVGFRGRVETDASFRAFLTTIENHRETCAEPTWNSMMHYAQKLKSKNIRIAFFSSTPQGGGVALMRHALVRFARLAGVDLRWYGM